MRKILHIRSIRSPNPLPAPLPTKGKQVRFGMSGCFLPADMNDLTPEMCRRARELGFSGIFTRFRANDPHTTPKAQAQRGARPDCR